MNAGNSLDLSTLRIRPLPARECLNKFRCGEPELDRWARDKAHKFHEQRRARVFTAHLGDQNAAIGFYALSLSRELAEKLSDREHQARFDQGAYLIYITYLGVAQPIQRNGIGRVLLLDSLRKAFHAAETLPIYGIGLRSLNEKTTGFYKRMGFSVAEKETDDHPLMIMPIWTVIELFTGM